ncbi:MAG: hypothetical protein HY900_00045 [Deltaproteobacteria bacterium]|nr:hypothetical protein [Deltaproteobacteria bacterium]
MARVHEPFRDPFLPVCDSLLYYELPDRAEARRLAVEALNSGRSVWVSGPRGSGRAVFLERVAEDVALRGRSVLWAEADAGATREGFLAALLRAAADRPVPEGLEEVAQALYEELLAAFGCSGTPVCFPSGEPLGELAAAEARILSGLRVAGFPLVALALCGSGEPLPPDAVPVRLMPLSPDQLRDCLLHRATVCGAREILSPEALEAIVEGASGVGDAVARARQALRRSLFAGTGSGPVSAHPLVFDPTELDDVGRLLDALAPSEEAVPEGDPLRDGLGSGESF